jgi:gliding motility-associated-like protein
LQDVPNIQETISTTNQSVVSSLDTATGFGFSWQLQCSYLNGSRISKINGSRAVCKGSNNLYYVIRGGDYSKPISFSANAPITVKMLSDTTASVTFLSGGTCMLYASMEAPCGTLKDSLMMEVQEFPVSFSLGGDTVICPNNKIVLNAGSNFSSYVWQDGTADSLYSVTDPGTYYVTVTDACGRSMSDTITVNATPSFNFSVGMDREKCNADTLHLIAPAGFYNYNWSPDYNISSTQSQHVIINPLVDTFYSVTAEKYPGCLVFDTVRILVKHAPEIRLGNDTFLCNNQSLLLNAGSGFDNYLWSDGKTTADHLVTQPGVYAVTAHYNNGCNVSDTISISDNFCSDDIYVPTAFSPNNDGLNEIFKPVVSKPLVQYRLQVFTRWGQQIFETTDINKGWDGKFKGTHINVNAAVWICDYQFEGKIKNVKRGTVLLIK